MKFRAFFIVAGGLLQHGVGPVMCLKRSGRLYYGYTLHFTFLYNYFGTMEEMIKLNFCVYVLFSELDHQLYVGYTNNISRRMKEHNEGRNNSTKHRTPFKLIFLEYYLFKEDAISRELYFKSSKGKRMMKLMLNHSLKELGYLSHKPLD